MLGHGTDKSLLMEIRGQVDPASLCHDFQEICREAWVELGPRRVKLWRCRDARLRPRSYPSQGSEAARRRLNPSRGLQVAFRDADQQLIDVDHQRSGAASNRIA